MEHDFKYDTSVPKGQDAVLNFLCAHYYSCVEIVPESVYLYRLNEGSVSVRFQKDAHLKVASMINAHRSNIEHFGEDDNEDVMSAYYRLCLYSFKEALSLGIFNPACDWNRKKRMAWLNDFCNFDWVLDMTAYYMKMPNLSRKNRRLIKLLHSKKLGVLDFLYHGKIVLRKHKFSSVPR